MPSTRVVVLVAAALGLVALTAAAAVVLARDGAEPVEGDVIAYSCREQHNRWYAICSMQSDGTEQQRLTSDRLATSDPAWSPDGRRIAFTRNQDEGESTTFTTDEVFVMDADGRDVRQLTPEEIGMSSGQPTWSPDGKEIAYVRGESVASVVPSRYGQLFAVNADGGEARRITAGHPDTDPDWSPDGRAIAFTRGENLSSSRANDDLYVLDLATGATHQLTRTPPGVFEAAAAWSPDGSLIAFARVTGTSQFDGAASIHVINSDGTGGRLVLEHKLFAYAPYSLAWSPDGRSIAFETSPMIGCTSISVVGSEGGSPRALTTCARPIESSVAPAWQPAADHSG